MTSESMPLMGEFKVDQIMESKISTVIALLPTSLKSRMRPIGLLRRSISLHSLRSGVLVSDGGARKPRPLSETDIPTIGQEGIVTEVLDQNDGPRYSRSTPGSPRPMRRVLCSEAAEDDRSTSAASGIHWKFARQGTSLVSISTDGGRPAVAEDDVAFERKAYVDGVTYLLKGLPQDLDAGEIERIQAALPQEVLSLPELDIVRREAGSARTFHPQPRSLLHRGVQVTVVNLIIILGFLMPYIICFVRYLARTERKYKVSESLVGYGMDFVNELGKQGIHITEAIGQMNDGKVRQGFLEVVTWTVDGVTGGISEGLGEGLSIIGSRNSTQ